DLSTPERAEESWKRWPAASHPTVRVHPESGRKALYVNRQVRFFVGMSGAESKPLIDYLTDHAVRPQNVYRHVWKVGDLVMWDNRCTLHMSLGDFDRTKRRTWNAPQCMPIDPAMSIVVQFRRARARAVQSFGRLLR